MHLAKLGDRISHSLKFSLLVQEDGQDVLLRFGRLLQQNGKVELRQPQRKQSAMREGDMWSTEELVEARPFLPGRASLAQERLL